MRKRWFYLHANAFFKSVYLFVRLFPVGKHFKISSFTCMGAPNFQRLSKTITEFLLFRSSLSPIETQKQKRLPSQTKPKDRIGGTGRKAFTIYINIKYGHSINY